MIVELDKPLGRILRENRAGIDALLTFRFNGVGLLGVFWSPRGVPDAFDGVWVVVLVCFDGVDGLDVDREGVPGAEPLLERPGPDDRDRSRKEYSFL